MHVACADDYCREFAQSTILTIAHRLRTVIDYDRVCVVPLPVSAHEAYSSLSDYAPRPRKACGVRQTRGVVVQPAVELLQFVQSRWEAGVRYVAEVGGAVEACRMG